MAVTSLRARLVAMVGWIPLGCGVDVVEHQGALADFPEPTPGCACPDEAALCIEGICAIPTIEACSPAACGPNYVCNAQLGRPEVDACLCDWGPTDWETCSPRCSADADCLPGFVCSEPEGVCRIRDRCISVHACEVGEVCAPLSFGEEAVAILPQAPGYSCYVSPGKSPGGAVCTANEECASGECDVETSTCIQSCRSNADCDEMQHCVNGYCLVVQGGCEFCRDSHELCLNENALCVESCVVGSDCGFGDCVSDGRGLYCGDVTARCEPEEFLFDDLACLIHQTCWKDRDCADGYACILVGDGASGYCGRILVP